MRVLIVDDEEGICKRLQHELKKGGFEVEYTTSPEGVIERLYNAKREDKPYDLLFLDLRMPKIDGFELLKKVREERVDLDVIIITGYGDEDKAIEAIRLGAIDYLPKPISLEDLRVAIFRVQQKRALEEALRHSILVVDDENDLCDRIKRELDKEGYHVAVAYDGDEGLDYFKNNRVDVVIADIKMPKMSGLDMLKKCREITDDFVSLIITGHGDHETAIEALRLGVLNYLKKPVSLEELVVSVNKGIDLLLLRRGLSARRRELEIETAVKEQYAKNLESMVEERTKELRKNEQKYRTLFEESRDTIYITTREGKFIDINQAGLELLGYTKEEMMNLNVLEIYANAGDRYNFQQEIERKGFVRDYEIKLRKKDGTEVYCLVTAILRRANDGTASGYQGIIRDITEYKHAEEKLRIYQAQLRSLASQLSLVEEQERRQIATELHDSVGQTLTISKIQLGRLRELLSSTNLTEHVDRIRELLEQAIQYTRLLIFELSPPILYEIGLEAAVEWLTEQIQEKHGIIVNFEDDKQPKPLNDEVRVLLFKAVRELLINIIKHARAHEAKVSIQRDGNGIRIVVEDGGVGFDIYEANSGKTGGFGLFSIRERLRYLGGYFEIESMPGSGTQVTVVAPLRYEDKDTMGR